MANASSSMKILGGDPFTPIKPKKPTEPAQPTPTPTPTPAPTVPTTPTTTDPKQPKPKTPTTPTTPTTPEVPTPTPAPTTPTTPENPTQPEQPKSRTIQDILDEYMKRITKEEKDKKKLNDKETKKLKDEAQERIDLQEYNIQTQYKNLMDLINRNKNERDDIINGQFSDYYNNVANLYEGSNDLLDEAYKAQIANNQSNYDYARGQIDANVDSSLRDAYINNARAGRVLNEQLANSGLTGGATESSRLGLLSNYNTNRADIQNNATSQLGALLNNMANNNATALQNMYANQIANQNNRTNALSGIYGKYFDTTTSNANSDVNMSNNTQKDLINQLIQNNNNGNNTLNDLNKLILQNKLDIDKSGADDRIYGDKEWLQTLLSMIQQGKVVPQTQQ